MCKTVDLCLLIVQDKTMNIFVLFFKPILTIKIKPVCLPLNGQQIVWIWDEFSDLHICLRDSVVEKTKTWQDQLHVML